MLKNANSLPLKGGEVMRIAAADYPNDFSQAEVIDRWKVPQCAAVRLTRRRKSASVLVN